MTQSNQSGLDGDERFFDPNGLIVSKTDTKGRITYANKTFIDISGYKAKELIGAPHSILRNPFMPRGVFKLMWEEIKAGREIFAYVVNRCKNNDYYWVLAHVTPSMDADGNILGFHSNRRVPNPEIIEKTIVPLYNTLRQKEAEQNNRKESADASYAMLHDILKEKGTAYDQFIFSLQK